MVDINTSSSALQAQLQASKQTSRLAARPFVSSNNAGAIPTPQEVVAQRIETRRDIPTPDRRVPVKPSNTTTQLSTADQIDDASKRASAFSLSREAPTGRFSNAPDSERAQPLGQIVNILV